MNIWSRSLLSSVLVLPVLAQGANDRPVEATKYVNAQGVEIYVPRMAKPAEAASAGGTATTGPVKKDQPIVMVGGAGATHAAMTETSPTAPRRSTPAATTPDEGRIDILMQELMTEQQALDVKRKALRSPRADVDLAPADRQKLLDDTLRHEENIRALGRELEQTRGAHTGMTKTALRPAAQ